MKIVQWSESIMMDSFGDLTCEQFKKASVQYVKAIQEAYSGARIDITLVEAVGCSVGLNEVEFEDGSVEPTSEYNDIFFEDAMRGI